MIDDKWKMANCCCVITCSQIADDACPDRLVALVTNLDAHNVVRLLRRITTARRATATQTVAIFAASAAQNVHGDGIGQTGPNNFGRNHQIGGGAKNYTKNK